MIVILLACVPAPRSHAAADSGGDSGGPAEVDPLAGLAADAVLHLTFEGPDPLADAAGGPDAVWARGDDVADHLVPGPSGAALAFDGEDDYLAVEDADVLDPTGPFGVLAWFRADPGGDPREAPLLDKYATDHGRWTGWSAYLDGGQPFGGVYSGAREGVECGGSRRGTFDDGAWHLYAMVFDGTDVTVSVDAARVASCAWTAPALPNADRLEIGTRGGQYLLRGALDEVLVVPRAVSDEEIDAAWAAGGAVDGT